MMAFRFVFLLTLCLALCAVSCAEHIGDYQVLTNPIRIASQIKITFVREASPNSTEPILRLFANKMVSLDEVLSVGEDGTIELRAPFRVSEATFNRLGIALLLAPILAAFANGKRSIILLIGMGALVAVASANEDFELKVVFVFPSEYELEDCTVTHDSITSQCFADSENSVVSGPNGHILTQLDVSGAGSTCNFAFEKRALNSWHFSAVNPITTTARLEFSVRVTGSVTNALVGLGKSGNIYIADLASAIRFTSTGSIDIRNGGSFTSQNELFYTPGQWYDVVLDLDVTSRRYSVSAGPCGGSKLVLGTSVSFRDGTESTISVATLALFSQGSGAIEVAAIRWSSGSTPSSTPVAVVSSNEGFTRRVKASDTREIFVSSSSGNDDNTCLSSSAPCKTIQAGMAKAREGFPDHVLLKRGDVFQDETINYKMIGRTQSEPAVISFYGSSGDRPRIRSDKSFTNRLNDKWAYVTVIGLHFQAYKNIPTDPQYNANFHSHANFYLLGGHKHILVEDNIFEQVEIISHAAGGPNPQYITIRRNIFDGSHYWNSSLDRSNRPSNIYTDTINYLTIEENVLDYGGWHPTRTNSAANMFNHGMYLNAGTDGKTLVVRNNIVVRAAAHGVQARGGGLVEDNFFARVAIGFNLGYGETPIPNGVRAYAYRNIISEGRSMVKGDNACAGTNLCTSAFWGIVYVRHGGADFRSRDNIVHSQDPNDSYQLKFTSLNRKPYSHEKGSNRPSLEGNFSESGNIAWRWSSATEGDTVQYVAPGRKLQDYNADVLGGSRSFDSFMNDVKKRPLQTWDSRKTAVAVNAWIRAGFARK